MHKSLFLLLLLLITVCAAKPVRSPNHQRQQDVKLPLEMKLPNDQWHLAVNEGPYHFIYKRNPIKDAEGRDIIPAIMIYSEDAKKFNHDVSLFWSQKMQPYTDNGVKASKMLIWQDKDYPLTMKNAVFVRGNYSDQGVAHTIYMIYIIDKHNKGIQIYMDMTSELDGKYGNEFWDAIKSIKEL